MTSRKNHLAQGLRDNEPLLGVYYGYPAEGILETIGPGWDFVWIDGQHGQFSFDGALRAVRTASGLGLETSFRPEGDGERDASTAARASQPGGGSINVYLH